VSSEIFINYRRADSGSYGALLYVDLNRYFGPGVVFMDSMSIPAGIDFAVELLAQVRRTQVVLAVIGPAWLTAADAAGGRLIDDPDDWVRRELVAAFAIGARVIPVLTDGATLPTELELPADIAGLARCQYRYLRAGDVVADLDRLHRDLLAAAPGLAAARSPSPQPRLVSIWLPGRRAVRWLAHWSFAAIVASAAVTQCLPAQQRSQRHHLPTRLWRRSYFYREHGLLSPRCRGQS
jgi:TIR domain